jgi:DNA-3-methyladenine glycosylase II
VSPRRHPLDVAATTLAGADAVMERLVGAHGPCRFGPRPRVADRFGSLGRSIVSQQLAGAAAASIWARLRATVGDPFDAAALLATPPAALADAGLSRAKAAALRDLAERVADGRIDLRALGLLDDEGVAAALVEVRGIGRWTAEMFCIFGLHRLDVWPVTDLGVRHGYASAHGLPELPSPRELDDAGDRFRPFRSVAAWYCWRASEAARAARRQPTGVRRPGS